MVQETKNLFELVKEEEGFKVIDLSEDMNKYELLSHLFHHSTILVQKDKNMKLSKSECKRYFADSTVCYKCGEIGHGSKECPNEAERNCFFCDTFHKGKPCEYSLCLKCLNLGHFTKHCRERYSLMDWCDRCPNQRIHLISECPKPWRRYNLNNLNAKKKMNISCAYCFSNSHFADDCEYKQIRHSIFTLNYLNLLKTSKTIDKKKNQ